MSDPNTTTITADTDDLDAFSDLFAGRVKEQIVEEVEEELPFEDDPLATEEVETEDVVDEGLEDPVDEEEDETLLKVKPKQTAKERIKELVAKNHETERREAAEREARLVIERRLEELEAKKAPEPKKVAVATDTPDPEDANEDGSPKYPLGEFDPTYIRDLTRHTIRMETEAAREQERQAAREREAQEGQAALQQNWSSKLEGVEERLPDFRQKAQSLESTFANLDGTYAQYLASTIMSLDYGPDVLYYLSNNLDEAKRIASEGPTKATLSLGRIEARFANQEEKPKRLKVSQAPTPPPAHTKGTKASRDIPDDTDDLDAFSDKFFVKRR